MKQVKSYTSIWSVEKVIYAINDLQLPFPVTFTQMAWFVLSLLTMIVFGDLPPLNLVQGTLLKYIGIPIAITWFMCQKSFDGKKPFSFVKSVIVFGLRPKVTYGGKPVKTKEVKLKEKITYVRGIMSDNTN